MEKFVKVSICRGVVCVGMIEEELYRDFIKEMEECDDDEFLSEEVEFKFRDGVVYGRECGEEVCLFRGVDLDVLSDDDGKMLVDLMCEILYRD